MKQRNSNGETVRWKSMVEHWNSHGWTVWWNSGTVKVELWWNRGTVMVEQCGGTVDH